MISDVFLSECKYTDNQSYSLKKTIWNKIKKEAYGKDKTPVMNIDIDGTELVVLSQDDFDWLLEESGVCNEK